MLPKLDVPMFEVILPSTEKKLTVRPFTVKEEKLLLMAANSKDPNDIITATKQVVNNCIVDKNINIDTLPFFDIDYLFITLRAKSVGEVVDMNFTCNQMVDGKLCGGIFPVQLDITKATIINRNIEKKRPLSAKVGAMMKYPTYATLKRITSKPDLDIKLKTIVASIDYLYDDTKIYPVKDMKPGELEGFVDNLTQSQLEVLEEWVDKFPSFFIETKTKCPKCGFEHDIKYSDFESFF